MQKHKLLVIRSKLLSHPPPFAIRKEMEIDEIFFSLVYRAKKKKQKWLVKTIKSLRNRSRKYFEHCMVKTIMDHQK